MSARPSISELRWSVEIFEGPARRRDVTAIGWLGPSLVGLTMGAGREVSVWWPDSGASVLRPSGIKDMCVRGASGSFCVGSLENRDHAVLVALGEDGPRATVLHPGTYRTSMAMACSGEVQVGFGEPRKSDLDRALVWRGTAESLAELRAGGEDDEGYAASVDGNVVGGWVGATHRKRAAIWRLPGLDPVELHPNGWDMSGIEAVSGEEQVGMVFRDGGTRPVLWRSDRESFVDLTPPEMSGGWAHTVRGGVQGGYVSLTESGDSTHRAHLWQGQSEGGVDLHAFVPEPFNRSGIWALDAADGHLRAVGSVSHETGAGVHKTRAAVWSAPFP